MSQALPIEPHQQAEALFRRIERRTAHILEKLHMAAAMILEQDNPLPETISAADLEFTASHWQELVPELPDIRAILLQMFIENYPINENLGVKSLDNLGWNDLAVRAAFEHFYGSLYQNIRQATV